MTFEQYWQEYCTRHKMDIDSPMCVAVKHVAKDMYSMGWSEGYDQGCDQGWEEALGAWG